MRIARGGRTCFPLHNRSVAAQSVSTPHTVAELWPKRPFRGAITMSQPLFEQGTGRDLAERHPWTLPWWKAQGENRWTLVYIVTIHILAFIGIAMFPIPGWKVFLWSLSFAGMGALGTTVAYHRALAHRAVKLTT